jgi:hypothetical protein
VDPEGKDTAVAVTDAALPMTRPTDFIGKVTYALTYGTSVDIHQAVEEDEMVAAIHQNAEVFDPKAEQAFAYLQVGAVAVAVAGLVGGMPCAGGRQEEAALGARPGGEAPSWRAGRGPAAAAGVRG